MYDVYGTHVYWFLYLHTLYYSLHIFRLDLFGGSYQAMETCAMYIHQSSPLSRQCQEAEWGRPLSPRSGHAHPLSPRYKHSNSCHLGPTNWGDLWSLEFPELGPVVIVAVDSAQEWVFQILTTHVHLQWTPFLMLNGCAPCTFFCEWTKRSLLNAVEPEKKRDPSNKPVSIAQCPWFCLQRGKNPDTQRANNWGCFGNGQQAQLCRRKLGTVWHSFQNGLTWDKSIKYIHTMTLHGTNSNRSGTEKLLLGCKVPSGERSMTESERYEWAWTKSSTKKWEVCSCKLRCPTSRWRHDSTCHYQVMEAHFLTRLDSLLELCVLIIIRFSSTPTALQ